MTYVDGPASFFIDLSRVFEQLKRDQLSSPDPMEFYYYIREQEEARQQEIPVIPDKQIALIKKLAPQSGFEVSETKYGQHQSVRLLISITDEEVFANQYNKLASAPQNMAYISTLKQTPTIIEAEEIRRHVVEPGSYDAANGILTIGGNKVYILKQENRKGNKLTETKEARLMRLLFNPVNTLRQGVPMRLVLSVTSSEFKAKHRKLVKSYIAEINKKVKEVTGVNDLIISNQNAYMVDDRYLKK